MKLLCGMILISVVSIAADLSKYRDFQLGGGLADVLRQTGLNAAQVRVTHVRPVVMQELNWRPQTSGVTSRIEPVKDVTFNFSGALLYRITVDYDRYETEGMTSADIVESMSVSFGPSTKPLVATKSSQDGYSEPDESVAEWQDALYRFVLIRSSYGPSFKLVGTYKKLEAASQVAITEAVRLETSEAPQREAERIARDNQTEQLKLEKARLVNKPKFRP